MSTKKIGPKGQVLIPNTMREALGLRPGVEVNIELKDDEIVITRPKIEGSYTEYYTQTRSPKLKKPLDVKKIILEEDNERIGVR
ncbi:MAG: AbrB/MazE/SpoVT family DNA-binding domain-containing protein [Candidatus Bathyarchaeota archaeon]|nr:AbrB/MazE/SpoVT family DNA-binding domain-containing protein [Candidatus Bathyarchaeota archaeon]